MRLKSRQKPSKSQPDYHAKDSSAEENTEPPVSPPMFSRDRWHALRLSSKAFEVEVLHQCQRFRAGTKQDPEELKDTSHPVVKFLVEESIKNTGGGSETGGGPRLPGPSFAQKDEYDGALVAASCISGASKSGLSDFVVGSGDRCLV